MSVSGISLINAMKYAMEQVLLEISVESRELGAFHDEREQEASAYLIESAKDMKEVSDGR